MKKFLLTLVLLPTILFSQEVDTIISSTNYVSYFSYETRTPLFVVYKLYKGGGECSRKGMQFETGGLKLSATKKDYIGSGYDKGHLANAEDFAYNCVLERKTFFYYNAIPQLPHLNRGCWEDEEKITRNESQSDSILIICGGYSFNKKIGNVGVPDMCFRITKNINTKKLKVLIFYNDENHNEPILSSIKTITRKLPLSYTKHIKLLIK